MAKRSGITISMNVKDLTKTLARLDNKRADKFMNYFNKNVGSKSIYIKRLDYNTATFWKNNVYKIFNKRKSSGLHTTGQLGRSLYVVKKDNTIIFKMRRLTHPKGENNGGGKDYDYGRYLRNDRGILNRPQEQTGRWVYGLDKKVYTGNTTDSNPMGIKMDNPPMKEDKWPKWESQYSEEFKDEAIKMFRKIYIDYYKNTRKK